MRGKSIFKGAPMPATIISGGQTGVDQAALRVAKTLGIATGGWMPKGWRTEQGPRPEFRDLYGMQEHARADYAARTQKNVEVSDATLLLGSTNSRGCRTTLMCCRARNKPFLAIPADENIAAAASEIRRWIGDRKIAVLNVAGNREETEPGIGAWAEAVLIRALGDR